MDKKQLKEKCVNLYLSGKTYTEISKEEGYSRKYISDLIKDDARIIEKKNNRKIKVYKRKNSNQMIIYIPNFLIRKLGISNDNNKTEYVNITFNKETNSLIIKKV